MLCVIRFGIRTLVLNAYKLMRCDADADSGLRALHIPTEHFFRFGTYVIIIYTHFGYTIIISR